MHTEKTCFKCLRKLPIDAFYKHAQMGDGHLNKCKECTKKDALEHRQLNLEKIRSYDRMRAAQPHRMALSKKVQAAWRIKHPKRRAAEMTLGNAVRSGLVKKQLCFMCGEHAEAHHPDYDSPLDVVWLCPPHHKQLHAQAAKNERENERIAA